MPRADQKVCALPLPPRLDAIEAWCGSAGVLTVGSGVANGWWILAKLVLLVVALTVLVSSSTKSAATGRAGVVSLASRQSKRSATIPSAPQRRSPPSATATRAERVTNVVSAPPSLRPVARRFSRSSNLGIAGNPSVGRAGITKRSLSSGSFSALTLEEAANVPVEPDASTAPEETTVPTRARATNARASPRLLLRRRRGLRAPEERLSVGVRARDFATNKAGAT